MIITLDVTDEVIGALTETIVAQTSGPILLAKRFPVPGVDSPVVLGGDAQISCARAIARGVVARLVQLSEKEKKKP